MSEPSSPELDGAPRPNPQAKPIQTGLPLWRLAYSPELVEVGNALTDLDFAGVEHRVSDMDFDTEEPRRTFEFRVDLLNRKKYLANNDEFQDHNRRTVYQGLADRVSSLLSPKTVHVVRARTNRYLDSGNTVLEFVFDSDDTDEQKAENEAVFSAALELSGVPEGFAVTSMTVPRPKLPIAFIDKDIHPDAIREIESVVQEITPDPFVVDLSAPPQILIATANDDYATRLEQN